MKPTEPSAPRGTGMPRSPRPEAEVASQARTVRRDGPGPASAPAASAERTLAELAEPARRDLPAMMRARALRLLSRREYSHAELRAKLLALPTAPPRRRSARRAAGDQPEALIAPAYDATASASNRASGTGTDRSAVVDAILDDLASSRLLSDRRFAEIVARAGSARLGVARIARVLTQKGVDADLAAEALAPMRASERERALALWRRRYGATPVDVRERARQHRFLLGRGFDAATVHWVLKQAASPREDG